MSRFFSTLLLLSFLFMPSCSEYRDHYISEHVEYQEGGYIASSGSTLAYILLPDRHATESLVSSFDHAKKRIWVEIYTWTEKDSIEALIRAYHRGVDIRVILEGNVYGTPRINDAVYKRLTAQGISIVYADNNKYKFTHAKFWIIDNGYCVNSGNITASSFQKNRDIIVCDQNPTILGILSTLFLADAQKLRPNFSNPIPYNLAISPINMRSRLMGFIAHANSSLSIFVQSVTDTEVLDLLEKKAQSGVSVRLCIAKNEGDTILTGYTFPIVRIEKPYIHIKSILVDGTDILIGSINLTENAIENNREVALIYRDVPELYQKIEDTFSHDCFPQKFAK